MGCTNSKQTGNTQLTRTDSPAHKANPLTDKEIAARIEAPQQALSLELAGVKYRIAYVSQRGYYPESPNKENQDAFAVNTTFGGGAEQQSFFAIYDGHGKDGHYCARFARDHLGRNILDKLSRVPAGGLNPKSIRQALTVAHAATNDQMHADKRFDDSLSGTTAISLLMRGRMMYVSNVGDSRAIVVSALTDTAAGIDPQTGAYTQRLVAKPLSSDQTPYRKDERERIKKYGSRILSMDQIEGIEPIHENWGDLNLGEDIDEGGDPPRVWSQHGNYPGTAFTRSLGDMIAEECGVIAEPEILEREIHPTDKYIVIASDGVFEFLTNQMVADILSRYTDPLPACKAVVQTAYEMWLQYEVRTDDISIIALFIDDVAASATTFDLSSSFYHGNASAAATAVTATVDDKSVTASPGVTSAPKDTPAVAPTVASSDPGVTAIESLEARPVRRTVSREKRKNLIQLRDEENEEHAEPPLTESELSELVSPKSATDEKTILSAMKSNFLFTHLSAAQRLTVVGLMKPVKIRAGEWVIRQGDAGDKFYIVDCGRFEVRVKTFSLPSESDAHIHTDMSEEEKERVGGVCVHVYESGPEQHPGFGELSLMYGKPRAASVIALTDGLLWALDRRVFKRVVLRPRDMRRDVIRILKKVELLKCLNVTQLQRLTDLLNERAYTAGSHIITQGEEGTTFFLLVSGQCDCTINDPLAYAEDGSPLPVTSRCVMQLKEYDYFGERALLESKPRAANVIAVTDCKVLYIDKAAFEEVLGPLSAIIAEDRARREALALAAQALHAPQALSDLRLGGVVLTDALGAMLVGTWGPHTHTHAQTQTEKEKEKDKEVCVTVRALSVSEVRKSASNDSAKRFIEVAKLLRAAHIAHTSQTHNKTENNNNSNQNAAQSCNVSYLLPTCLGIIKQSNAVHLVFGTQVVADLASFVRAYANKLSDTAASNVSLPNVSLPNGSPNGSDGNNGSTSTSSVVSAVVPAHLVHLVACVVSALERLHETHHVVYRAVQPESLYLDSAGNVVLLDFRFAKTGLTYYTNTGSAANTSSGTTSPTSPGGAQGVQGGAAPIGGAGMRAFTVCGASDYLSPEQIAQSGHSYPVDQWGLGVLLYELAVGAHPFSASSEVATYSRITSFGSKAFPALPFNDHTHAEIKALVNVLLVPTPEARITLSQMKKHAFFSGQVLAFAQQNNGGIPVTNMAAAQSAYWSALAAGEVVSPLFSLTQQELKEVLAEGVDHSLTESFAAVCDEPPQWMAHLE